MTLAPPSPFDAAPGYRERGWFGTLPLPQGEKYSPPTGFTGHAGRWPTDDEVAAWYADGAAHNLGLRLPADIIGIDVDHYLDKRGADTLAALEAALGALPPAARSSRRGASNPSGIRLYRAALPEGRAWRREAGEDIDLITNTHRYLVAAPSVVADPESGEALTYQWHHLDGSSSSTPPRLDDPRPLSPAWIEHLTRAVTRTTVDLDEWLAGLDDDEPSPAVRALLCEFEAAIDVDRAQYLRAVDALAIAGERGAIGVPSAVAMARATYEAVKGRHEAADDFDRALTGSLARIASGDLPIYAHGDALAFGTREDFERLVPQSTPRGRGGAPDEGRRTHTAEDVLGWILGAYRVGRSTDGLVFAVPTTGSAPRIAKEIRGMRSTFLRAYREHHLATTGRGVVLGRETLGNAIDAASAYAEDAEPVEVAIRAAQVDDGREIVLDLGTADGQLVRVTPAGWEVVTADDSVPLFRRSEATQPLPLPTRGGSLDALRDLLGLGHDDARWLQVRGWLVASLFAAAPRPLLWATGPQGSGKSTRARMVLSLVEPTAALGKEPGRNERDDSTAARGRFLVSYDNITTVSQGTSDWLCRLVTGVTDDRRQLYSDDGLRPVTYRRSGVVTSISLPPGLRSDALERVSVVPFDRVPDDERRPEGDLWRAYEEAKPALLGALLDDVALVLQHLPAVAAEGRSWPRMADYAQILAALDRGLVIGDDEGHRAAYVDAVDGALAEAALDDPFAAAVIAVVDSHDGRLRKSSALLVPLLATAYVGSEYDVPPWWPKTARSVSSYLDRAAETLRHAGIVVTRGKTNGERWVDLSRIPGTA